VIHSAIIRPNGDFYLIQISHLPPPTFRKYKESVLAVAPVFLKKEKLIEAMLFLYLVE